jgi:hypothetical protein
MGAAPAADPVRDGVEQALRRLVADVLALPCHAARRVREGVAQPVALAGSLVSLTVDGLLGRGLSRTSQSAHVIQPPRGRPPGAPEPAGEQLAARALPIEEYESLAASQVVARLERLDANELEQIEQYELANRGRRTVLGKIAQLAARR